MTSPFQKLLMLVSLTFILSSCGDLFMKKSSNSDNMNQFATCKLDPKALSKIFTENLRGDLICLKENLELFVDIVKTDRPGNLSYRELKIYIEKNFSDVDPAIMEALTGVFEINSLIYGDDTLYIDRKNIPKLTNFLIDLNKVMVENKVYEYFVVNESGTTYLEHNRRKSKVFSAFTYLSERLEQEFRSNERVINLVQFLERFKTLDNNKILQNCTKLLFFKKMFLGGREEVLTSMELRNLARMMPDISKVVFDMVHMSSIIHSENEHEEILLTYKENAEAVVKNLYYRGQDYVVVMSLNNVFDVIDIFFPEYLHYKKYTTSILKAKGALLENSSVNFNSNELMILLNDIVLRNLKKGAFFYRMYAVNEGVLSRGTPIVNDLGGIMTSGKEDESFREDFNRIIKSYRFFKGKEYSASFNNHIKRNALGVFEIAVLEDIVKRIFAVYGNPERTALGGYRMTQRQLEIMMAEYEEFLLGEGFTDEGRINNTAETITLMTSLFQSQSDGDSDIEVNEMVEFAIELMSAGSIAKMGNDFFKEKCEIVDNKDRYTPECYREHFVAMTKLEKNGVKVSTHLGKLSQFLNDPKTNVPEYLKLAEVFTRSCTHFNDGKPVPMAEGDLFVLLAGMMAVEQTMVRYDANNDNILQPAEVEKAFEVYESAIKAMIPGAFLKQFAKTFYLYLIKYKKVPDVGNIKSMNDLWRTLREGGHFAAFFFKSKKNKQSDADRYTLATILKTLSEMSPANIENPFPCEILR
jgi:hypothetical protein